MARVYTVVEKDNRVNFYDAVKTKMVFLRRKLLFRENLHYLKSDYNVAIMKKL